jgi:hypothetical protein
VWVLEDERWCEEGKSCAARELRPQKVDGRRGKTKEGFSDEIFRLHVGRCGATAVGDGVVEGMERRGDTVTKQRAGEVDQLHRACVRRIGIFYLNVSISIFNAKARIRATEQQADRSRKVSSKSVSLSTTRW